jgi:xanthine/uracil permease
MLGNLVGGFIVILIGVQLLPVIADSIAYARNPDGNVSTADGNVTGASSTIVGLTTIFYALGIMSAGVALAVGGLKEAGVM